MLSCAAPLLLFLVAAASNDAVWPADGHANGGPRVQLAPMEVVEPPQVVRLEPGLPADFPGRLFSERFLEYVMGCDGLDEKGAYELWTSFFPKEGEACDSVDASIHDAGKLNDNSSRQMSGITTAADNLRVSFDAAAPDERGAITEVSATVATDEAEKTAAIEEPATHIDTTELAILAPVDIPSVHVKAENHATHVESGNPASHVGTDEVAGRTEKRTQYHLLNGCQDLRPVLRPESIASVSAENIPPIYDSHIDQPLGDNDLALMHSLVSDFAKFLTDRLENDGRFDFLHFLLFKCSRPFVDMLLPALTQDLFDIVCAVAALHKDAETIEQMYPLIPKSQVFSLVASGRFQQLAALAKFTLFHEVWCEAIAIYGDTAVQRYAKVHYNDAVSLYTTCGENSYALPHIVFETLHVPREACITLALKNIDGKIEDTLMLRHIIEHASDGVHADMQKAAMTAYTREEYSKFVRLHMWLRDAPDIPIPAFIDCKISLQKGIKSVNFNYVRPKNARHIAKALAALDWSEPNVFFDYYITTCIDISDFTDAVALVWELGAEALFYREAYNTKLTQVEFVAHALIAARRAGLANNNIRLWNFYTHVKTVSKLTLQNIKSTIELMLKELKLNVKESDLYIPRNPGVSKTLRTKCIYQRRNLAKNT